LCHRDGTLKSAVAETPASEVPGGKPVKGKGRWGWEKGGREGGS